MKKRPDLDAIVFDLGQVLVTFDPLRYLKTRFPEPVAERINSTIYSSKHWAEVDRSVLTMDEIKARILRDAPDMAEWFDPAIAEYFGVVQPIPENVALLPKLREAGYKLYVLSNFGAEFFDAACQRIPFLNECFDGLLISGQDHLLKPNVAIYLLLLHRYGLDPARTVFVDDRQENIDGAKTVGIRGICYSRPEQLRELWLPDA